MGVVAHGQGHVERLAQQYRNRALRNRRGAIEVFRCQVAIEAIISIFWACGCAHGIMPYGQGTAYFVFWRAAVARKFNQESGRLGYVPCHATAK